jgi:hypothetical protein
MTPEALAVWLADHRRGLRRGEQLSCSGCRKGGLLAVVWIASDGRRILWIEGRQKLEQSGSVVRGKPRALWLDDNAARLELAQCMSCRRGALLMVQEDQVHLLELKSPTRATVVDG